MMTPQPSSSVSSAPVLALHLLPPVTANTSSPLRERQLVALLATLRVRDLIAEMPCVNDQEAADQHRLLRLLEDQATVGWQKGEVFAQQGHLPLVLIKPGAEAPKEERGAFYVLLVKEHQVYQASWEDGGHTHYSLNRVFRPAQVSFKALTRMRPNELGYTVSRAAEDADLSPFGRSSTDRPAGERWKDQALGLTCAGLVITGCLLTGPADDTGPSAVASLVLLGVTTGLSVNLTDLNAVLGRRTAPVFGVLPVMFVAMITVHAQVGSALVLAAASAALHLLPPLLLLLNVAENVRATVHGRRRPPAQPQDALPTRAEVLAVRQGLPTVPRGALLPPTGPQEPPALPGPPDPAGLPGGPVTSSTATSSTEAEVAGAELTLSPPSEADLRVLSACQGVLDEALIRTLTHLVYQHGPNTRAERLLDLNIPLTEAEQGGDTEAEGPRVHPALMSAAEARAIRQDALAAVRIRLEIPYANANLDALLRPRLDVLEQRLQQQAQLEYGVKYAEVEAKLSDTGRF